MRRVRCNKCGHVADESTFPKETDFFQDVFIASCPNADCNNKQNPGDASMRMFGGERPFTFLRPEEPKVTGTKTRDAVPTVMHRSREAS